jgi:hypothetical protein
MNMMKAVLVACARKGRLPTDGELNGLIDGLGVRPEVMKFEFFDHSFFESILKNNRNCYKLGSGTHHICIVW